MDSRLLYEFCANNVSMHCFGMTLTDPKNKTDDWFYVDNDIDTTTENGYILFTNKFIVRVEKCITIDCDMFSTKDMGGEWSAEITHRIMNNEYSGYKNMKANDDDDIEKFIIFALNN